MRIPSNAFRRCRPQDAPDGLLFHAVGQGWQLILPALTAGGVKGALWLTGARAGEYSNVGNAFGLAVNDLFYAWRAAIDDGEHVGTGQLIGAIHYDKIGAFLVGKHATPGNEMGFRIPSAERVDDSWSASDVIRFPAWTAQLVHKDARDAPIADLFTIDVR